MRGKVFEKDWTRARELENIYSDISYAVAIPVNVTVKAEHRVLDLSSMRKILSEAETIAKQDCDCKINKGNCEASLETCINIDDAAESLLARAIR